jgi:hypothetical protein
MRGNTRREEEVRGGTSGCDEAATRGGGLVPRGGGLEVRILAGELLLYRIQELRRRFLPSKRPPLSRHLLLSPLRRPVWESSLRACDRRGRPDRPCATFLVRVVCCSIRSAPPSGDPWLGLPIDLTVFLVVDILPSLKSMDLLVSTEMHCILWREKFPCICCLLLLSW